MNDIPDISVDINYKYTIITNCEQCKFWNECKNDCIDNCYHPKSEYGKCGVGCLEKFPINCPLINVPRKHNSESIRKYRNAISIGDIL